jgi:hypothetical protein
VLEAQFGLSSTQLDKVIPKGPKPSREMKEIIRL